MLLTGSSANDIDVGLDNNLLALMRALVNKHQRTLTFFNALERFWQWVNDRNATSTVLLGQADNRC